ncbi:cytochrome C [Paramagnetospirillum kuznetsovii]|uniref:Cytochrome C n=1 Tax=Paramagnetospirillum kuznetsovii TaxID=2053833 RepID=A0A364P196_9PROT|nr:diheme cytochrome c [Paramagnetospirillum kuznetsovii]RAU23083.1 cytochrome C [Paramagnetospirillum kuznetsovii]
MKKFALAFCLAASPALADFAPPITDPVTLKACGECHMAFQPSFLPARSWDKMMANPADHFGDNATMAPDKAAQIRKVLMDGAADTNGGRMGSKVMKRQAAGATPLRITETAWFQRKHDLPERVWKRPGVVTKSNCVACHPAAEKGIYEDD